MPFRWTEDLTTGVAALDRQHHDLIETIAELVQAMQNGKGRDHLSATLQFLDAYATNHFGLEESLMREEHYPEAAAHLAEHKAFAERLASWRAIFEAEGPSSTQAVAMGSRLYEWLRQHVAHTDRALGRFLVEHGRGH